MRRRADAQLQHCLRGLSRPISNLLDVGCGYGGMLEEASRMGIPSCGLEYDQAAIQYGLQRALAIESIVSEDDIVSRVLGMSSGIVIMSHVLEHMRAADAVLSACHRCRVFIEVPAYRPDILEQFEDQEGHLHFYNERSLTALLDRLGFTIEAHGAFGPNLDLFWRNRWSILRRLLRLFTRDYFFHQYRSRRDGGIWLRALARGKACKS